MFELPFQKGEVFGGPAGGRVPGFPGLQPGGASLERQVFLDGGCLPGGGVSLRSASPENVVLQADQGGESTTVGEVDLESAPWMVHPRAVYLHEGQQYFVQELDFERHTATLIPVALDYYTEPLRETDVSLINLLDDKETPIATKA